MYIKITVRGDGRLSTRKGLAPQGQLEHGNKHPLGMLVICMCFLSKCACVFKSVLPSHTLREKAVVAPDASAGVTTPFPKSPPEGFVTMVQFKRSGVLLPRKQLL